MAIIASNDDAEKAQQVQTEEKKEAGLSRKEDGETMHLLTVELTRKKLYEDIWKLSVAGGARKYGIPYAKCLTQIKTAQIPVPLSGYWTKINFRKQMEQTPLPDDGNAIVTVQKDNFQKPNTAKSEQVVQTTSLQERAESVSPNVSTPMVPIPQSAAEETTNQVPPETVQRFRQTYNVYNRETLYQEVWNMPVTGVAKRYKVSDVAIHKVCKSLNTPTLSPGY